MMIAFRDLRRRLGELLRLVLAFALLCLAATAAAAQPKLALVIGINGYRELPPLEKARADAEAVARTLGGLGFGVDLLLDPERRALNRGVSDFLGKITPGATVYVHYSGHGVEIDGDAFLLPVDMPLPRTGEKEFVKREAVSLSGLIESLRNAQAQARVLVIDACRDNPFASKGTRSIGSTRGIELLPAPKGTLIMYSAASGQTALDKLGQGDAEPTSVYTRILLKHLAVPGKPLVDVADSVRSEVEALAKTVGHEQRPAYYDEIGRTFALTPGPPGQVVATPAPAPPPVVAVPPVAPVAPPPPAVPDREAVALQEWQAVQATRSPAVLRAFMDQHRGTRAATYAAAMLREIEAARAVPPPAAVTPPVVAPPPPPPVVARPPVQAVVPPTTREVAPAPARGTWVAIAGSFPPGEMDKARTRLAALRARGFDAFITTTDGRYPNLTPGLIVVMQGPIDRESALAIANRWKSVVRDAYAKQAR